MWKVRGPNATVYLLGSIHLSKPDLYPLPNVIEQSFNECSALAVELNPKKVNAMEMMKHAMYQDTTKLKDHIKPETYNMLKEMFDKMKLPPMVYDRMKPWFAVQTAMIAEMHDNGYGEQYGLDMHFLNKADSLKIEIREIESLELQLAIFDDLDKNPDAFVKYSLEDKDNSIKQVEDMFIAWKTGDTKKMENIVNAEAANDEFKDIMEKLIDQRNIGMTRKIEEYMQKPGKYFVIVGAGHIVGQKGILELLKQKGYTVTQQ
jgi:uncharacterized protein YbaP (TraB family)